MNDQDQRSKTFYVVVGSHPTAEREDRPTAYRLLERIDQAVALMHADGAGELKSQILTDLWFMNDPVLVASPAIALGTAGTNAAVAHFSSRLPQALVVDGKFEILLDRASGDHRVCLRGVDGPSTALAVDAFIQRFMAHWIEEAASAAQF